MIQITALMDNKMSENKALINEHGLSFLIEKDGKRILFDTGSCEHTIYNAHRLGMSLVSLDSVVLSHSHYDHAAGFRDLLENGMGSKDLFIGRNFFEKKYAFDGTKYTDLSCGFEREFVLGHNVAIHEVSAVAEITEGIYAVGDFPRVSGFETIPSRFVRRSEDGFVSDDFSDEICLVIDKGESTVMICGCSHPGITNMVKHVFSLFKKPVSAVFGGIHLNEADQKRMDETMGALFSMGLSTGGFCHCSGDRAEEVCVSSGLKACHLAVGDTIFI